LCFSYIRVIVSHVCLVFSDKAGIAEDVSVHRRTSDSVSVLWSPPKTGSSHVTAYQVHWPLLNSTVLVPDNM